jgi:hypothetical protein
MKWRYGIGDGTAVNSVMLEYARIHSPIINIGRCDNEQQQCIHMDGMKEFR